MSVLGQTLAVAPGDESGECGVPDYPVNIKVLLDSWRYQTLLPDTWTATNSDPNNPGTVSISLVCVHVEGASVVLSAVVFCWWGM